MRYNVPRLGPDGGFVHAATYKLDCELLDLVRHYLATSTPEQVLEDFRKANEGWEVIPGGDITVRDPE